MSVKKEFPYRFRYYSVQEQKLIKMQKNVLISEEKEKKKRKKEREEKKEKK